MANLATGHTEIFPIDDYKKYCLENALDDIDYLIIRHHDIEVWERSRPFQTSHKL